MGSEGRSVEKLLGNIAEWGEKAARFVDGISEDEFMADELRQAALSKCVEVIGEAAGELLRRFPGFVASHPELALPEAYRMRNRLAHGYDTTSSERLWNTVVIYVPELVKDVRKLQAGGKQILE